MTSVSELFYQRRSRFGRNSDPLIVGSDLATSPPPPDRANRRHRNYTTAGGNQTRRNRLDPDGCDRHALHHSRQTSHHRPTPPPQERESSRLEEGGPQHSLGNTSHSETQLNVQDRLRFHGNDRLPGPVLLARERLLQRLRGVTLSSSRRSNRSSSSSHRNDIAIVDEFRLVDSGDWQTEISGGWVPTIVPISLSSKRPPGLSEEALRRLSIEEFCIAGGYEEHKTSRECSICLESFSEGDQVVRLPCNHRYHFCCLDPWARTCGDCPNCRRAIDSTLDGGVKDSPDC